MHRPPAVAWEVGPSRWQKWALTTLILLSVLVWAGFTAEQGFGMTSLFSLSVAATCSLPAVWAWRNAPTGHLRWDGEQWYWTATQDFTIRSMACVLDRQVVMLLQASFEDGRQQWFWLGAGNKPAHWSALRRAIVASANRSQNEHNSKTRGS